MNRTKTAEVQEPHGKNPQRRSPEQLTAAPVSAKIQRHHLQRRAVVYVRQSTPHQVIDNRESADRQYSLVRRAVDLGWAAAQVEVIDEDQGMSGKTAEGRLGFQRLLAEVGLNRVGIILGLEMSRLARSCRDWHQLLELCGMFGTLLADQDGLYDPTDHNDRLLLGLTGIMSEAELHILRKRMHEGKLNKARRGELFTRVPAGYLLAPTGEVTFDPDEQVRSVIHLVLDKFAELRSASAVLHYLVRHRIQLGGRVLWGPNRGALRWRRPTGGRVLAILHNPAYAGVYAYGRRSTAAQRRRAGQRGQGQPSPDPHDWQVFLRDKLPAYITWDQYLANQRQLQQNQSRMATLGAAREGLPLLSGLLTCGQCGARMLVVFRNRNHFRYVCCQQQLCYGGPRCQSFAGRVLDQVVGDKVLGVLAPAELELSLRAART